MPKTSGEKSPIVYLSMLFKWYAEDFGSNKLEILKWIHQNMATEEYKGKDDTEQSRKLQIENILDGSTKDGSVALSDLNIKYIPYDWGNNAKKK